MLLAGLLTFLGKFQDFVFHFISGTMPAGDFTDMTETTNTDIICIQCTQTDAGGLYLGM
jgi:hypothetical protein